jgi:hypothetical protein
MGITPEQRDAANCLANIVSLGWTLEIGPLDGRAASSGFPFAGARMRLKVINTPLGPMTLKQAAKASGLSYNTIKMRVYQDCPVEKLFKPSLREGSKRNPTLKPRYNLRQRSRCETGGIIIGVESSYWERWEDRKAKKMGATRAP